MLSEQKKYFIIEVELLLQVMSVFDNTGLNVMKNTLSFLVGMLYPLLSIFSKILTSLLSYLTVLLYIITLLTLHKNVEYCYP